MANKWKSYEYLLSKLLSWFQESNESDTNNLSVLKTLKLLFFVTAADIECSEANPHDNDLLITSTFNNFYAMPLGHVESDIYANIVAKKGHLDFFKINKLGLLSIRAIDNNDDVDVQRIDQSIHYLKTHYPHLINMEPFELVDLTHKWNSWKYFFNGIGSNSTPIPSNYIIDEPKYFQ
jgi:hypothetical protein